MENTVVLNRRIEKVIEQGGHVRADLKTSKKEWTNFTLRISKDMIEEIDIIMQDTVGISRTGWILQAIQEKLRK